MFYYYYYFWFDYGWINYYIDKSLIEKKKPFLSHLTIRIFQILIKKNQTSIKKLNVYF